VDIGRERVAVMATFSRSDDLRGAEFVGADLRGARFVGVDLSGVVMRGVDVAGAEIDGLWLSESGSLLVNGVDVIPFVEAELDRRFPGRAADEPVGPPAPGDRPLVPAHDPPRVAGGALVRPSTVRRAARARSGCPQDR
jgi:Pentapeptide repeats (8 copies)